MARIRTIKPEFWMNEKLASISEHARLLAIALLNHADDGGYFLGNHHLVKAACFPFEDNSKKVLGSIQELSDIGYIELKNCDGKLVGKILKFTDHQRIDKPQKSKYEDIFYDFPSENDDSKNDLGVILESSRNDQRLEQGTGNREQGNGTGKGNKNSSSVGKPDGVQDSHWEDWLAVRKAKRAGPVTKTVLEFIRREAAKVRITLDEAISIAAGAGWITFNSTYSHGLEIKPRLPTKEEKARWTAT